MEPTEEQHRAALKGHGSRVERFRRAFLHHLDDAAIDENAQFERFALIDVKSSSLRRAR